MPPGASSISVGTAPAPSRRSEGPAPRRSDGADVTRRPNLLGPNRTRRFGRVARRTADRDDPPVGDRRRPHAGRPIRPPAPDLRGLHGVGPSTVLHRGLRAGRGPADVRQHPHRGLGHRPSDDDPPGGSAPDHPPRGRGNRPGRGPVLRHRRHRCHRHVHPGPGPHPARGPGGGQGGSSVRSCSSARTSITPTSCPGGSPRPMWSSFGRPPGAAWTSSTSRRHSDAIAIAG